MTLPFLVDQIEKKSSFLCVGLDVDLGKIPSHLLKEEDPIFAFNKAIIDATHSYAVAYKPNMAFYEAYGVKGWLALEKTIQYLNLNYPEVFTIADAKRGDIGNTASRYAKAFFEDLGFDSLTVAPYMGKDSVEPFLAFEDKFTILLGLTSNPGAADFEMLPMANGKYLYETVIETAAQYKNARQLMYVVGATQANAIKDIRALVPDSFLLVPGVGAQGGSLKEVCSEGLNEQVGLLVNSSRGIIYASSGEDFALAAAEQAALLQTEMAVILSKKKK
ncbi:orotidine-5'-phosphate decarboxylase [Flavobacteriaceae bacterium]|nr:orotidine-5'-phosphate decarboxylase [Flavobacteriaceae bacterium]